MSKKPPIRKIQPKPPKAADFVSESAVDFTRRAYAEYGTYVLEERAIPALQDGLKPVQRRVLFSAYQLGARPGSNFKKSATIVGATMGSYHPHGDSAIYEAMVKLTNPRWTDDPRRPIDPQGNFGGVLPADRPAAMRYTEARLSKIGMECFRDIDVARTVPNYDGTKEEPWVLPSRVPNLLLIGSQGVGVGAATEIPEHNLNDVVKMLRYVLAHPDVTVRKLARKMPGPDYGHSIMISDREDVTDMYATGRGTLYFCCKHHIERGDNQHELVITSYAPNWRFEAFQRLCSDLLDEGKILAHGEESKRNQFRYVVSFRDPTVIEERVLPRLRSFAAYNWNVVDKEKKKPEFRMINLLEFCHSWLDFRRNMEKRRLRLDLHRRRADLSREAAKMAAIVNLEVLAKILNTKTMSHAQQVAAIQKQVKFVWTGRPSKELPKDGNLSVEQVELLLDQTFRQSRRMNLAAQSEKLLGILDAIAQLKKDLKNIDGVIDQHLSEVVKEFGGKRAPRGTELSYGEEPELALPEGTVGGFWNIDVKGFVRQYDELPERKGAWPKDSFTVPMHETVTVVAADGIAYRFQSVYMAKGRLGIKNIVGLVGGNADLMLVMTNRGRMATIENPPRSAETTTTKLDEGEVLVGAWGVFKSDTVAFLTRSTARTIKASKLPVKRPNTLPAPSVPRVKTAPRVLIIPKGGCVVLSGQGRVDVDGAVGKPNSFALGKSTYVVTPDNNKRTCTLTQATSVAREDGIKHAVLVR